MCIHSAAHPFHKYCASIMCTVLMARITAVFLENSAMDTKEIMIFIKGCSGFHFIYDC